MHKDNIPKNPATGSEKFAPNKNLNMYWINLYKFSEGTSHSLHKDKFIFVIQEKLFRLWNIKFIDIKVNAHLHIFVVTDRGCLRLYSFSSRLISVQNHTDIDINMSERFKLSKEWVCFPMKSIKLIKNKIDIFQ